MLNYFHEREAGTELTGMPAFISQCCYQNPDAFSAAPDLKTAYLNFLTLAGEGGNEIDKRRPEKELLDIFTRTLRVIFNKHFTIGRYKKRDRKYATNKTIRPMGVFGVGFTDGKTLIDSATQQGFEPVDRIPGSVTKLPDVFGTDCIIPWYSTAFSDSFETLQAGP